MRDEAAIQIVEDEGAPAIGWLIGMGADFGGAARQDEITHYRTSPANALRPFRRGMPLRTAGEIMKCRPA